MPSSRSWHHRSEHSPRPNKAGVFAFVRECYGSISIVSAAILFVQRIQLDTGSCTFSLGVFIPVATGNAPIKNRSNKSIRSRDASMGNAPINNAPIRAPVSIPYCSNKIRSTDRIMWVSTLRFFAPIVGRSR